MSEFILITALVGSLGCSFYANVRLFNKYEFWVRQANKFHQQMKYLEGQKFNG